MPPDVTVLIATYNRAKDLEKTLEGMARAERKGFSVEFVVIDNGSTDHTRSVAEAFRDRMPLRYIFEGRSGKNRALNTALETCELGRLVAFTDDDIDAPPDWLTSMRSVCDRWPDHSVFGGRIYVVYPDKRVPEWARDYYVSSLALGQHAYSEKECVYQDEVTPFGGNLWVRREVFDNGRRYDEKVGPRQKNRMGGSETSFLDGLLRDGYGIVYSPFAVVGHRIQPEVLKFSVVCRRAYHWGRARPYIYGLPQQDLLEQHPAVWRLKQFVTLTRTSVKVALVLLLSHWGKRLIRCAPRIEKIGYHVEAMRIARERVARAVSAISTPGSLH